MKVVILAGGLGTRLAEESSLRPKPMVEIGGKPMLWHIMNIYSAHGYREFLIACGYKGEVIKEYFTNFRSRHNDAFIELRTGVSTIVRPCCPDWNVGLIDTGLKTMTGGRLRRLRDYLADGPFMVTYGDGVADVDVHAVIEFHRRHGKLATLTAVHPPARFGALQIEADQVAGFTEKPQTGEGWINGGFMVFEPKVLDYIDSDEMILEREPLERLSADNQLMAYKHQGFWQPMDTLREKQLLESMWESGKAPWKVWEDNLDDFDILSTQTGADHRAYRIQGGVAGGVAEAA
ncbi:MAG: glucose-1-phosphate cytidylyltransferase [Planctomycetes bacterium]|nr:glucose-1-phosphate cytidylyltransferase [Planctomycetota bacterium]